jgi:hypothetical protein
MGLFATLEQTQQHRVFVSIFRNIEVYKDNILDVFVPGNAFKSVSQIRPCGDLFESPHPRRNTGQLEPPNDRGHANPFAILLNNAPLSPKQTTTAASEGRSRHSRQTGARPISGRSYRLPRNEVDDDFTRG